MRSWKLRTGEPFRVVIRKRKCPSPTTSRLMGKPLEIPRVMGVLPHMPKCRLPDTKASTIGAAEG